MQAEQVEAVGQTEQPTGQITGTPPTTLVARLRDGLLTHVLLELNENPLLQRVQNELLVQVMQLLEQTEQNPLER